MALTRLKVDDETFVVASLIKRCPRVTMLREVVMNAIEAARLAPAGRRRIEIGTTRIEGFRKLRVWNTGPGMTRAELFTMGDLSASIRKRKSLKGNFGIGVKVSTLTSNPLGVRYRSCAGGRVHEMILGCRNDLYGRVRQRKSGAPPGTKPEDVIDVTEDLLAEGADLAEDWTELVLLGAVPEQDTAADPYGGEPSVGNYWVPDTLYRRFLRIRGDVEIVIEPGLQWFSTPRRFESLEEHHANLGKQQTVETTGGIRIHYLFVPPDPAKPDALLGEADALQSCRGLLALVYHDEMYHVLAGSHWASVAAAFGIPFAARHVSILIELPDDYPAAADTYRQFLRATDRSESIIKVDAFSGLVVEHCPTWLRQCVRDLGSSWRSDDRLQRDVAAFATSVGLRVKHTDAGYTIAAGELPAMPLPELLVVRNEQDLRDRWLLGRAASYMAASNQLFLNPDYPSVHELEGSITEEFGQSVGAAQLAMWAPVVAEQCLVRCCLRAVASGLAKHADPRHWAPHHIGKALSPEALTMVCADLRPQLPFARRAMHALMGVADSDSLAR